MFFKFHPSQLPRICLLLSLVASSLQKCLADAYLPNLMQDSTTILITQQERVSEFQYPMMMFDQHPNFAFSVHHVEWTRMHLLNYTITYKFDNNALVVVYTQPNLHQGPTIRKIGLTIWATSRRDILTGILDTGSIQPLSHQSYSLAFSFANQNSLPSDAKVFTSILSLDTLSAMNYLHLETEGKIIEGEGETRLSINVSVGRHSTVNRLSISYIVYTPSRLDKHSFSYAALTTQFRQQQADQPLTENIKLTKRLEIYPLNYVMVGITGLLAPDVSALSLTFNLQSQNVDFLSVTASTHLDKLNLNYLVLGNNLMMSCIQCPDSYVLASPQQQAECVGQSQCPGVPVTVEEGLMFACKQCSSLLHMELDNRNPPSCRCMQGYVLGPSGGCERIQLTHSTVETCSDSLSVRNPSTGKCQCLPTFTKDVFGFCAGECSQANSYWDYNVQRCECFTGFSKGPDNISCLEVRSPCAKNEVFVNNKCECDTNSVYSPESNSCVLCPAGEFKDEVTASCQKCYPPCRDCFSGNLCLNCLKGYFYKDLKCFGICGDGFRVLGEQCDDGNSINGDGCNSRCQLEEGYECEQQDSSADICKRTSVPVEATTPQAANPEAATPQATTPQAATPQAATPETVTPQAGAKMKNETVNGCKFGLSRNPIYLNGGIVLELTLEPASKHTQDEINNMFRVTISKAEAVPRTIYYSQNQKQLKQIRCYLEYNSQLPPLNFEIAVGVRCEEEQKMIRVDYLVGRSEISSAMSVSRGDDELL